MRPRRIGLLLGLVLLCVSVSPAWAVKEWYDYYLDARDRLIPAGKYQEALTALEAARRLKAASALNEQTYGLQFIDYLPYYYEGVCHLKLGDFNSAERLFNIEEAQGAIGRSSLRPERTAGPAAGNSHR